MEKISCEKLGVTDFEVGSIAAETLSKQIKESDAFLLSQTEDGKKAAENRADLIEGALQIEDKPEPDFGINSHRERLMAETLGRWKPPEKPDPENEAAYLKFKESLAKKETVVTKAKPVAKKPDKEDDAKLAEDLKKDLSLTESDFKANEETDIFNFLNQRTRWLRGQISTEDLITTYRKLKINP